LAERRQSPTLFISRLIETYYSTEFSERTRQHFDELKEIASTENEIPIFVCTLALPYTPCPLHIYEPQYRLMIRRAIESGANHFGMCMYSESTPFHYAEYGCLLDIKSHQFTRDGRAIVATEGTRRFKVIKSSTKDGYNVAQIEWVRDERVQDPSEIAQLQSLHDEVYKLGHSWYSCIPDAKKDRIRDEIYGIREMPEPDSDIQASDNGPYWFWFLLNILPIEHHFQYKFLTKISMLDRLKQMKKILIILMTPIERLRQMNQQNSRPQSASDPVVQSPSIDQSSTTENRNRAQNSELSPSNTDSSINVLTFSSTSTSNNTPNQSDHVAENQDTV
jgi:hypothetical protein